MRPTGHGPRSRHQGGPSGADRDRARRAASLRRHRPHIAPLARPPAADALRTSDLVLAVTGVTMLGILCLALANGLLAF